MSVDDEPHTPRHYTKDFEAQLSFKGDLDRIRVRIQIVRSLKFLIPLSFLTILAPVAQGLLNLPFWPSVGVGIALNVIAGVMGYYALTRNIHVDHFPA
jgi:hypothetical protein